MKCLRSILSVAGLIVASALFLPLILISGLIDRSGRLGWVFTRLWARIVLRTGGVQRLRSEGFDRLSRSRGAVLMSNHESLFDPVVMMALSKTPLRFLARHDLFYLPLFGWAMWANGHVPVCRGSRRRAHHCLRKAARVIASNNPVLLYPEGTRSSSAEMLPFKKGGFLLAVASGAPIIPIGIADTRKVCPKGWHWAGCSPVAAVAGSPIETAGYTRGNSGILMTVVRDRIAELRAEATRLNATEEK